MFIHAWSGCDTTSATFGMGKTNLVKTIQSSEEVQQISVLIGNHHMTEEEIGKAGTRLFVILFGGKQEDSLNFLQYVKYLELVTTSKAIDPQKLPPTERAAYFHSLRVHLQIILWKELKQKDIRFNPEQWGWKLNDSTLIPVMTDIPAGLENLLKFVRCKCKLSSRNPCGTNACTCRKNGLKCVTACGDCRGNDCKNAENIALDDTEENNDFEDDNIL